MAAATATMAAAGFDKRSSSTSTTSSTSTSSSLRTPGSGGFPSELRSPLAGSPSFHRQRDYDLKTPITPPSAYLDFLRTMSPAMTSPALTTGTSTRFSFNADKYFEKPSEKPTSQPSLSRNTSYDSATSTTTSSTTTTTSITSTTSGNNARPTRRQQSPHVTIPPSPFVKPAQPSSARTPRKLVIPQSPLSTGQISARSPYVMSSTPMSAAPWSASFSPRDIDTEAITKPGKMYVKQVVTRTVTYCRTPLDAVPDGNLWKRRKVEHEPGSKSDSDGENQEPEVKTERCEEEIKPSSKDTVTTEPAVSEAAVPDVKAAV